MRIEIDSYYIDRANRCHGPMRMGADFKQFTCGNGAMRWAIDGEFDAVACHLYDLVRPATPQEIAAHHKTRLVDNSPPAGVKYVFPGTPNDDAADALAHALAHGYGAGKQTIDIHFSAGLTDTTKRRIEQMIRGPAATWALRAKRDEFQKRYEDERKVTKQQAAMIAARDEEITKLRAGPNIARAAVLELRIDIEARDKEIAKLREQVRHRDAMEHGYGNAAMAKEIRVLKAHMELSRVWRAKRVDTIEKQGEIIRSLRRDLEALRIDLGSRAVVGDQLTIVTDLRRRDAQTLAELQVRFERQRKTIAELQEEARRFRDNLDEGNRALQGRIDQDAGTIRRLQEFKLYVHKRLDDAGIPSDPPGAHHDNGCRVGQRLDILVARAEALPTAPEREVWDLRGRLEGHAATIARLTEALENKNAKITEVLNEMDESQQQIARENTARCHDAVRDALKKATA